MVSLPTGPEGAPPKRLCLLRVGRDGVIRGKDGRAWKLPDPTAVLRYLTTRGNPLTIDENHSHERKAPKGEPSPALARVRPETVSVNATADGVELWANDVDWTPYGEQRIKEGAYLGLSPAIVFDTAGKDDTLGIMGSVVGLSSAGLVNDPNLDLPASLNDRQVGETALNPELCKILGLPEDATEEQIKAAVTKLAAPATPAPAAPPVPTPAVNDAEPPAWAKDFITATNNRLDALSSEIKTASVDHKTAVNSVIERFVTEGKLPPTPEARNMAEVQCQTPEGLAAFEAYYKTAPKLVATEPALNDRARGTAPKREWTETQIKLAASAGTTPEELFGEAK